jgi:hypothetical protein
VGEVVVGQQTQAATVTPSAGFSTLFPDSADGNWKAKKPDGSVVSLARLLGDLFNGAMVNVKDYGALGNGSADDTAAIHAACAAVSAGGTVFFPVGTYIHTGISVDYAHVRLMGATRYQTVLKSNATTGYGVRFNQWYQTIESMTIQGAGSGQVTTKTAGYGIDCTAASAYGRVKDVAVTYQYDCINIGNTLMDIEDAEIRYYARDGIAVTHNSDHRISKVTLDNNTGALPTGGGIHVSVAASLLLDNLNIIHANQALWLDAATGVTIPSVKATNCFFDNSANGLLINGAGSVFRSEFTNCWFSSMSVSGISLTPAAGGNVDGITFINCDIYNNVAGTTHGVLTNAQTRKWKMVGCSVAGWTNGINLQPGANHFPTLIGNTIGAVSAFGVNATGINVTTGTYRGLVIQGNDVVDNTGALALGTVTVATWSNFRITDNPGINPRGTVTTPAVPAAAAVVTNTTGFRVIAAIKFSATAPTAVTINGVATGAPVASQRDSVVLEPGGTISFTTTAPASWVWSGL